MKLAPSDRIEIHRRMLRIRGFEEEACRQHQAGRAHGALHLATGQEGAVVGACAALRESDWITGTHRSHGHPIAKGAALGPLLAELLGRRAGVCGGKGGSMHLADFSVGSLGESGIVGSGISIATGAALSARVRRSGQVSLCFFGDGAANEGAFHECLNMASLWKLPAVYFCENNGHAATTPARSATSIEHIADRAAAYAMPGVIVDGQDAVAVHAATSDAVERARRGEGPSLVEAKTFRYEPHAFGFPMPDARGEEELARWKQRDPIALHRASLLAEGLLDEAGVRALEAEVAAELARALEFALASEAPEPAAAFENVRAAAAGRSV